MKYNTKKREFSSKSYDSHKTNNAPRDSRGDNNSHIKHHEKKQEKKKVFKTYKKSEFGFLLISFVITPNQLFESIKKSLDAVVSCSHAKKKIVVSFVEGVNSDINAKIQEAFKIYNITFFTRKASKSQNPFEDEALVHNEVFNSFKSDFFLSINSMILMQDLGIEKMIKFLSKPSHNIAISPKFYDSNMHFVKSCRRFKTFLDIIPPFLKSLQKRSIRLEMMERGEIGYCSIHRIDWSFNSCMFFLSEPFKLSGGFVTSSSMEVISEKTCKKFAKIGSGEIVFLPSVKCVIQNQ